MNASMCSSMCDVSRNGSHGLTLDPLVQETGKQKNHISMLHIAASILLEPEADINPINAPLVALGRHFVAKDKKAIFEQKYNELKGFIEKGTEPYLFTGGWIVEKEGQEQEEFVILSGWQDQKHHDDFAKTEDCKKAQELVNYLEGYELSFLKRVEGL